MVRHHIHPWNWCHMIARGCYDVLAAIPCESTNTVEKNQVSLCLCMVRAAGLALRHSMLRGVAGSNGKTDLTELFYKWTITIRNNHAGYGLEQNSILSGDLVGEFYEDAATAVIGIGFDAGRDQS